MLWQRATRGDEPLTIVEILNHTPEPDGCYKRHFPRVHPQLRPMPNDRTFGPPQPLTAIASIFSLTSPEYDQKSRVE
jgi:uncharacterized protein DUF6745